MKKYKWVYKIINKNDVFIIKEGEWITDLPASKICMWFEGIGYEVVHLNRVVQVFAEKIDEVPFKEQKASVCIYKDIPAPAYT